MPWLDCDGCGRWTHIPCERTHASLTPNLEGIKFSCAACRDKIQGEKQRKKPKARRPQAKQGAQKGSEKGSEKGGEKGPEKGGAEAGVEAVVEAVVERGGLEQQEKPEQQHSDPGFSQSKPQLLLEAPSAAKKQSAVAEDLLPSTPQQHLLAQTQATLALLRADCKAPLPKTGKKSVLLPCKRTHSPETNSPPVRVTRSRVQQAEPRKKEEESVRRSTRGRKEEVAGLLN